MAAEKTPGQIAWEVIEAEGREVSWRELNFKERDQMNAAAAAVRNAALEEAARECESGWESAGVCASAIRALKSGGERGQ